MRRETAARLREAQAIAQVGNFYWHPCANQISWSEELFRIHGYDPHQFEATYEALLAAAHPEDRAPLAEAIQAMLRTQQALSHDYRILRRDGQTRWLHLRARVTLSADQQVAGIEGTCQDITERKAITDDLALFYSLVDRVSDALEVIDPATGCFLDVNAKACQELGYTREELLALTVPEVVPNARVEDFHGGLKFLRAAGGSTVVETLHRRKDGSTFPVEVSLKLVALGREDVVTVVRDISERKRNEAAFRESQERLELAASAAQIGFWDWNLETNEVLYSPEWKAQIGYAPEELDSSFEHWRDRLHPEDRSLSSLRFLHISTDGHLSMRWNSACDTRMTPTGGYTRAANCCAMKRGSPIGCWAGMWTSLNANTQR
ncbi:MAG: PAS domain S-box protein [Verrucomicrobiota bacterium]